MSVTNSFQYFLVINKVRDVLDKSLSNYSFFINSKLKPFLTISTTTSGMFIMHMQDNSELENFEQAIKHRLYNL